jgi:hypothetical protein
VIFAKPPGGFRWVESARAVEQIKVAAETASAFSARWEAIKARLVQTAAREGTPVRGQGAGLFTIRIDGAPEIWIVYQLHGDTLTVHSLMLR